MECDLRAGDCLEVLRTLADNSIDAVVTDPPYGLGFMGKEWDTPGSFVERKAAKSNTFDHVGGNHNPSNPQDAARTRKREGELYGEWCEEWAREVLRVLKPGGHCVAFSSTRTYHRMACAIEDAGFEVRDQLAWCYGTGFPKSHDVSKGIDEHEFGVWLDAEPSRRVAYRDEIKAANGDARKHVERKWRKAAGAEREVVGVAGKSGSARSCMAGDFAGGEYMETAPATDAARQWEGWGTALKPAWEPICLARKPLSERTVAANILRWGTGAINVDGCRIEATDKGPILKSFKADARHEGWARPWMDGKPLETHHDGLGRFPANLCHDGSQEVLDLFPESKGQLARARTDGAAEHNSVYGALAHITTNPEPRGDGGSAARFFYHAKASKHDRCGSRHPTVKPVSLMQWLVRMVTPPGGTILDPFAGSGTTAEAARLEGFNSILCEREAEYLADIRRRMDLPAPKPRYRMVEGEWREVFA